MVLIRKDGRRVDLRVIGVPIVEDGEVIGMYGIAEDITARKQAEEALHVSEARFRDVLNRSLDVAYCRNLQADRMDYLSPAIEQVTGLTVEQVSRHDLDAVLDRLHMEDRTAIAAAFTAALTAGQGQIVVRFRHLCHPGLPLRRCCRGRNGIVVCATSNCPSAPGTVAPARSPGGRSGGHRRPVIHGGHHRDISARSRPSRP